MAQNYQQPRTHVVHTVYTAVLTQSSYIYNHVWCMSFVHRSLIILVLPCFFPLQEQKIFFFSLMRLTYTQYMHYFLLILNFSGVKKAV